MNLFHAIVLALVQGATEFLPVSSSAHLVLIPWVFGWPDQGLVFDVAVNTGTLLAVLVYFRSDLARLVAAWWCSLTDLPRGRGFSQLGEDSQLAWGILLATIPVACFGFLGRDWIATAGRNPILIATTSLVFGTLLVAADRLGKRNRELSTLGLPAALCLGLAQALALIPGTSRSGITITAALLLGFSRPAATRASFLLAVPVSALAAGNELLGLSRRGVSETEWGSLLLATAVAAVAAYLSIGWLLAWVRRQDMLVFGVYRVLLALAIFAFVWLAAAPT